MPDYAHIEMSEQEWADWFESKQNLDKAKALYDLLTEQAKKRAGDWDDPAVDVIVNGEVVATIHQITAERFDSAKFKQQYPHIWAQFLTTSKTTRMVAKKGVGSGGQHESDRG